MVVGGADTSFACSMPPFRFRLWTVSISFLVNPLTRPQSPPLALALPIAYHIRALTTAITNLAQKYYLHLEHHGTMERRLEQRRTLSRLRRRSHARRRPERQPPLHPRSLAKRTKTILFGEKELACGHQ
jgi:hypothetical protein